MQARPPAPVAVRLLSVPVVAVGLLLGIWVTGGLLTNEFRLAMALTGVWIAVAGPGLRIGRMAQA